MVKTYVYDEKNQSSLGIYEPDTIEATIILIHGGGWFRSGKAKEALLAAGQLSGHRAELSLGTSSSLSRSDGRIFWQTMTG